MKMNTAVKMMLGAGVTVAMYKMAPQVKNMVTDKLNNSSNMLSNMTISSSYK